MREAMKRLGGDRKTTRWRLSIWHRPPGKGTTGSDAFKRIRDRFQRNVERYAFLRWGEGLRQFPAHPAGYRYLPSGQS
jgi:aconitase A